MLKVFNKNISVTFIIFVYNENVIDIWMWNTMSLSKLQFLIILESGERYY